MTLKLCTNCRFYQAEDQEALDICLHEQAACGGVREVYRHTCSQMRAGMCGRHADLYVDATVSE